MANILALFGILFGYGISYPALLTFIWLMWPSAATHTQQCIEHSLRQCFFTGLLLIIGLGSVLTIFLTATSGAVQLAGWALLLVVLTLSCIGATGLVAHLAHRLSSQTSSPSVRTFFRTVCILELAAAFPLIGWFAIWPLALCVGIGATWLARRQNNPTSIAATSQALTPS